MIFKETTNLHCEDNFNFQLILTFFCLNNEKLDTKHQVLIMDVIPLNCQLQTARNQRTIGPENAHLKPDPAVLSHHEMTLTLNTHTPLLNYLQSFRSQAAIVFKPSDL